MSVNHTCRICDISSFICNLLYSFLCIVTLSSRVLDLYSPLASEVAHLNPFTLFWSWFSLSFCLVPLLMNCGFVFLARSYQIHSNPSFRLCLNVVPLCHGVIVQVWCWPCSFLLFALFYIPSVGCFSFTLLRTSVHVSCVLDSIAYVYIDMLKLF